MGRKFYFDSQYGIESYALQEDGILCEYQAERAATGAVIGNIYKGRVTDVLNGMQAAFVDCGLERHCYISAADATVGRPENDEVTLDLKVGDEIMVQVTKAAIGKKGAKVTTHISFVGKYIVFLPTTSFVGVSAKISDAELRKNLTFSAENVIREGEGLIVRTAAPYAVLGDKVSEIDYFRKLFENVRARFENAPVGELLYSDSTLHMRVLRDVILSAGDEIHVGNEALYSSVKEITGTYSYGKYIEVKLHDPHVDLFYSEGITQQFLAAHQPKIELSNGAYIVMERTEALTVIDVNTGKFVGDDSLEHTVFCTNVLATREIARQVKLKNMGGIFVVDFIDMTEENHKKAIVQELERALKGDKGKCKVLPMSKFGLVEFTRKRTGSGNDELIERTCKTCAGAGVIRSIESILAEFRAKLLIMLSEGATTVCADINFDVANRLLNYAALKENIAALYPQARVYIVSHRTYSEDTLYFRRIDSPNFTLPEGYMLLY